jgi:anaerobic ribonucleoside-triphosphate reductase activating protein
VLPRSRANGPGWRYVIWSQGCALGCPGCFNPQTHPADPPNAALVPAGCPATADGLASAVAAEARHAAGDGQPLDGVTLTGGEPLEQPAAVAEFCALLRARCPGLGIVVLTGFTRREIERDPAKAGAVAQADMVIAGRYNQRLRLARGLRGSSNKEYWARSARYGPEEFSGVPEVEIILAPDGAVTVTGTPLEPPR